MGIDWSEIAAAGGIAKGPTGYEVKLAKQKALQAHQQEVYAAVTLRDGSSCRVCGKFCSPRAWAALERSHKHHLVYRSMQGPTETWNLLTLCARCHSEEHGGKLQLSGNADERDPVTGRLAGVKVERPSEEGWLVIGWV